MRNKITFEMICADFKNRYPAFRKRVDCWSPYDYATILIYLDDGNKMTYNYDTQAIHFLPDKWKN